VQEDASVVRHRIGKLFRGEPLFKISVFCDTVISLVKKASGFPPAAISLWNYGLEGGLM